MRRRAVGRGASERGAAAVEFAFIAPFLLILIFGVIAYGYMLAFRQSMSQAAAEGSRAVAVMPVSATVTLADQQAAARSAINESLDTFGVTCVGAELRHDGDVSGSCDVTVAPCVNQTTVNCASVALDYTYSADPLVPTFLGIGLPGNLRYTAVTQVN